MDRRNRHLLQPPVGKKFVSRIWNYIVMLVAGPNARKDYHYNETEELFWLEGSIKLLFKRRCPQGNGTPMGDMYILPMFLSQCVQRVQ
jgi:3-hydroxyanthranilate 3,4-dioxygenase